MALTTASDELNFYNQLVAQHPREQRTLIRGVHLRSERDAYAYANQLEQELHALCRVQSISNKLTGEAVPLYKLAVSKKPLLLL